MTTSSLRIPEGINYDCTGCGKCCSGWTVPLTEADYKRISPVDWGELLPKVKGKECFVKMNKYEMEGTPYTHKILETGRLGTCPFLVDNLCFIHGQRGSEFKPTMCQLFPYRFMETPSGVYTTVSFVSMATIYNTGKALTEQEDWLNKKWEQFRSLYPDFHPDWSKLNLAVGVPISWEKFKEHDEKLMQLVLDDSKPLEERLLAGSEYLITQLRGSAPPAATSKALNPMDRALVRHLHDVYFPARPQKRGDQNFRIFEFLQTRLFDGESLKFPTRSIKISALKEVKWPEGDKEIDNLLFRYLYSMLFSKTYCGPGFGHVSVVSGFHHMILIYALIKLHARGVALVREAPVVSFIDMVATVKQMETQLGETKLNGYSAALWELLLSSGGRAQRLIELSR